MSPAATAPFDAIVVGGGHNGLVCAGYLARAGLRPLVLERRAVAGGALATTELLPGVRVPALAHTVGRIRASIVRDLDLASEGLRLVQPDVRAVSVRPDGPPITLWNNPGRTAAELERISARDAIAWPEVEGEVRALARTVERLMQMVPPDPSRPSIADAAGGLAVALQFARMSDAHARALLRALPMPIADFLEDRFGTDALRALVAVRALRFTSLSPRSAGSTQVLLSDSAGTGGGLAGETVYARGGPGALASALVAAVRRLGGEVRTSAEVVEIRQQDGRVVGVTLANGDAVDAPIIAGAIDPKRLLLGLVDPEALGPHLGWQAGNLRQFGVTAKVNLALSDLPAFAGLDQPGDTVRLRGRIVVAPNVGYLDRATDAAKYGRVSESPWLEATIPTLVDPLLVDGSGGGGQRVRHVMSVILQSAPYRLRDGSWDDRRDEVGDLAIRTLETVAPGIGELVVARQVITPLDLERDYGLTGGHPLHGEPGLDQWFAWRPMLGWARHRMPLEGLYLGGSGAHPGGGVTGLPGRNAASAIVSDLRRSRRPAARAVRAS